MLLRNPLLVLQRVVQLLLLKTPQSQSQSQSQEEGFGQREG